MIRTARDASTCIFLLIIAALASVEAQQKSIVGEMAPDFSLRGANDHPVRLSDYKGKVVLVDFWATWCTPCQAEVPQFVAFQNTYAKQGFQMIGISMDDTAVPVRKFQARFKMNYPVAMGNVKVANAYGGVLGLPLAFLIGRDGRVIKQYNADVDLGEMEMDIKRLLASR